MTRNRLIALLAVLVTAIPLAAAPAAGAQGTSAVVVNRRDGSERYRLKLEILRTTGSTVDTKNLAEAVASCDSCRTVAVALQGVLVMGDPQVFAPENEAIATNVDSTFAETLAIASQFLVPTGGSARLTPEGRQRIAQIRRELESLRRSGLSIDEIRARVEQLGTDLVQVLLTDIAPAGPGHAAGGSAATTSTQAKPAPSGSATSAESSSAPTPTSPAPSDTTHGTTTSPGDTGTTTTPSDAATAPSDTTTTGTTPTGPAGDGSGTSTTPAPTTGRDPTTTTPTTP